MNRSSFIKAIAIASAALVAGLWLFPSVWYSNPSPAQFTWFVDRTNVAGWSFAPMPVSKSEEAGINADATFAGLFTNRLDSVHVFSAKRFSERKNEIGIFVHTPDRCWTESGWKLSPTDPDHITLSLHGSTISFERRIFVWQGRRRYLVYFAGLSGGEPLQYRLDHNLSVGQRQQLNPNSAAVGLKSRALNPHLWGHVWDVFKARRNVAGPKQFFRLSTEIVGSNIKAAEERLQAVLPLWLTPCDFDADLQAFKASPPPPDPGLKEPATPGAGH